MVKFLDLKSQYLDLKPEIDEAIQNVINDSAFVGGKYVSQFESDFANYVSANYCIGVGNGTDALEVAIEALNMPPKSEIIVPANSFIASSEAVTRSGHKVVFADVDPKTYVLSPEDLKRRITPKTKAVIAVHLYGHPCDMDSLKKILKPYNIYLIEDCAQAHGAKYKGKKVGSIGDIATFSFYPGKNLGAYGDAGAITCNSYRLANRCRMIANHGRTDKYNHEFEGRNSRLDGLQASVLSVKIKHIEDWNERRINAANYYLENLKEVKQITLPYKEDWAKQVYHLFVIRTQSPNNLRIFLEGQGIQTGIHYPISLPKLQAYAYISQETSSMFANQCDETLLSLPIGEHLCESDLEKVVRQVKCFFSQSS